MHIHKQGNTITTLEDWLLHAPPKSPTHWKDKRSAKEMARSWLSEAMQTDVRRLLQPVFGPAELHSAEPERLVAFDTFGEPRHCDLAVEASSAQGSILVHVEGKADEAFDQLVGPYYDLRQAIPGSKLPQRIDQLAARLFGTSVDAKVRALHYQPLHATAATCVDAMEKRCSAAVFLVHEFHSSVTSAKKLELNKQAWIDFLRMFPALQATDVSARNVLLGPVRLPWEACSIPLYFAKIVTTLA